jgi:hypothetical protein
MTNTQIAQTILAQINTLDARAMLAWGAKELVVTSEGLRFRIGGMAKFKGLVHIKYNRGTDLYDVDFIKTRKDSLGVVKSKYDLFAEDLVEALDSVIQ